MSEKTFINGQEHSKLSESELKEKADSLYKGSSLSESQIDLTEYRKQEKLSKKRKYTEETSLSERVQNAVLQMFGKGPQAQKRRDFAQLKTQYATFENALNTLEGDYKQISQERWGLQQEIQRVDQFVQVSKNHYESLQSRHNKLKAEINMIKQGESDSLYSLHEKNDRLMKTKNEMLDRYAKTEEGVRTLQSKMLENEVLTEQIDVYTHLITKGHRQRTEAKIAITSYELQDKLGNSSSKGFKRLYEDLAMSSQKMQEHGAPVRISEIQINDIYTINRDREAPTNATIEEWKNTPPPM